MNNALITGGVAGLSASVAALIQWFFTSIGHPVPVEAMPVLVAGAMSAGHVAQGVLRAKFGVLAAAPVAPAVPQ